jgi:hypothetical protein
VIRLKGTTYWYENDQFDGYFVFLLIPYDVASYNVKIFMHHWPQLLIYSMLFDVPRKVEMETLVYNVHLVLV